MTTGSNIKNILTELLFIPQKMTYCFDINSLAHLSVDFLENELKERQTHQSKKVITLVDNYVGDYYNYACKDYKAICLNPIYSKIFKASYVDSVNEREQKEHLRKMINQPLHEQIQEMQIVLKKEESGYKALSIYKTTFQQINEILKQQSALTKQENTEEYSKLETKKINLINKIIEKLN